MSGMLRRLFPLLLAALPACGANAVHWEGIELSIAGGEAPAVGESCALNVEVLQADGSSLGVLSYPVAAGTALHDLLHGLADAVTRQFGVDTVTEQSGGRSAFLYLSDGERFGSVSRAMVPKPAADPRGGALEVEQVAAAE